MPTYTAEELAAKPEHVLKYFAPNCPAFSGELIRRSRIEAGKRVERFFAGEVAHIKLLLATDADAWPAIVDYLLAAQQGRKMREYRVAFADITDFAGVPSLEPVQA